MADAPKEKEVTSQDWLALFGVMLGAFMAVLDIQITNASLNDISGALGSSLDEGSWISTAYLVAEIIIIGLSGLLAGIFSVKRYLLFSSLGFLLFSVLCAFSSNLSEMIVFRALQGITGGALIPLAFSVILLILPPSKRSIGLAMFGMTATFGPAIGPTIGGWLTDNYGWQWIFFINVPPGLIMLYLIWTCLSATKENFKLLDDFDYFGVITMAVGLGSLIYVLEEGERKDWFGNPLIVRFALVSAICITLFLSRELTAQKPFINLRILLDPSFLISSFIQTCLGFGLYGSVYLLPLYLSRVQHYNAQQIGITMISIGLPQLFLIPFIPKLMKIVDVRLILGLGVCLFGLSCLLNSQLDTDYAGEQFFYVNIIRALGQPLILIPILSVATSHIAPKDAGSASALFNMVRNLGGSIGIAMLSTLVTWREHYHSVIIGESVTVYRQAVMDRLNQLDAMLLAKGLDPATATRTAEKILNQTVQTQAYTQAFGDAFFFIGILMFISGLGLFFLPKPNLSGASSSAVH